MIIPKMIMDAEGFKEENLVEINAKVIMPEDMDFEFVVMFCKKCNYRFEGDKNKINHCPSCGCEKVKQENISDA